MSIPRFLEEQKSRQASEFENGREDDAVVENNALREKGSGMSTGHIFEKGPNLSFSKFSNHNGKVAKERYSYDDFTIHASSNNYSKGPPFHGDENGEDHHDEDDDDDDENEEEVVTSQHPMMEAKVEVEAPKRKGKASLSARELFDLAFFHASQDDGDLELLEEQLFPNRKQERAAAVAAALVRREMAGMLQGAAISTEKGPKARRMEKATSSLASTAPAQAPSQRPGENWGMDVLMGMRDKSPPRVTGKRGIDVNVRMDSLNDNMSRYVIIFFFLLLINSILYCFVSQREKNIMSN